MAWLSIVDPTVKLQKFRRERQRGTGTWLFDRPEMIRWLDSSNDALWIYGIPGAGKTMLSTLVVDEVLTRKRSQTIGTAYFYIRHDDRDSHEPSNVLGSLMAQLARQNPSALSEIMELYAEKRKQGLMISALEDDDLCQKLIDLTQHFTETYIMLDGLDECGQTFDATRIRLLNAMVRIPDNGQRSIRTLIFSRDEQDIRKQLTNMNFRSISIAAASADLRLSASAWLPCLNIRSERLKREIVDTLVDEANGM